MSNKKYISRRDKISEVLEQDNVIIVFANETKEDDRFIQDNNFLYFTGLKIPKAILVMYKSEKKLISHLFIERNIPEKIVWDGKKMEKDEAGQISAISQISYLDEFETIVSAYLNRSNKLITNYGNPSLNGTINKALSFVNKTRNFFPHLTFDEITNYVKGLRIVKDSVEIKEIRNAIRVTEKGLKKVFEEIKPKMMEYQVEAILYHEMMKSNLRFWAFTPIVASGKNATTLHYCDNKDMIQNNELVLFDVGAKSNNYSADISRTIPANGKFSPRQKEVYQKVLDIQKTIIESIKPGVTMKSLQEKTVELTVEALKELGLIEDEKDYKKYYMHGVSHFLGLDTHDIGDRKLELQAGMVLTVEPGIYIPEEEIGVRIEDDILVTEDGFENLSIAIPKEIEDLER